MNLNKVLIIGRATANPDLRTTPTGLSVVSFGVATNRVWTGKTGGRQEETEFHNIVAWGRQAEIASQFLTKGSLVFIEGRLRTRSWQDKQGATRKTTEIICERFQLGPKPMGGSGVPAGNSSGNSPVGNNGNTENKQEAVPAELPPLEELPVIEIEDEIKPEDIPF